MNQIPVTIPVTISMIFVRRMLSNARIDPKEFERYLRNAGIRPEQLDTKDARASAEQYIALITCVIERLDDEGLGFFSRPLKCGSYALVVRAAYSAPTLAQAIRRAAHTFRLLQDDVRVTLAHDGDLAGVDFRLVNQQAVFNDVMHENLLRTFWRVFAWLIGGRLPVAHFDFAFAGTSCAGSYEPVFPGERRFDCPHSALWFDAKLLQAPVVRDEQALRQFLGHSFAELIVPAREGGVSGRVRLFLRQSQPEWPDLASTAEAMHMAASTMQRHLAMEGVTFQGLKNSLRRDIAIFRLQTSQVSFGRLATELGFVDNAAFQRAFKAWTGSPPGVYQRKFAASNGRNED